MTDIDITTLPVGTVIEALRERDSVRRPFYVRAHGRLSSYATGGSPFAPATWKVDKVLYRPDQPDLVEVTVGDTLWRRVTGPVFSGHDPRLGRSRNFVFASDIAPEPTPAQALAQRLYESIPSDVTKARFNDLSEQAKADWLAVAEAAIERGAKP